jgi:hypothetical protein
MLMQYMYEFRFLMRSRLYHFHDIFLVSVYIFQVEKGSMGNPATD